MSLHRNDNFSHMTILKWPVTANHTNTWWYNRVPLILKGKQKNLTREGCVRGHSQQASCPLVSVQCSAVQKASGTLDGGQAEGHGGGRHQDVCEDGPVAHREGRGAVLQHIQHSGPHVPGHVAADVQQHTHMLLTGEG